LIENKLYSATIWNTFKEFLADVREEGDLSKDLGPARFQLKCRACCIATSSTQHYAAQRCARFENSGEGSMGVLPIMGGVYKGCKIDGGGYDSLRFYCIFIDKFFWRESTCIPP
jgi:hypothetical protein